MKYKFMVLRDYCLPYEELMHRLGDNIIVNRYNFNPGVRQCIDPFL